MIPIRVLHGKHAGCCVRRGILLVSPKNLACLIGVCCSLTLLWFTLRQRIKIVEGTKKKKKKKKETKGKNCWRDATRIMDKRGRAKEKGLDIAWEKEKFGHKKGSAMIVVMSDDNKRPP